MSARLRADLVVGGLWRGALVALGGAAWPVVHADEYGEGCVGVATLDRIQHMRPREAMLVLDDPLGLGLAGLAARVAERLRLHPAGWSPSAVTSHILQHDPCGWYRAEQTTRGGSPDGLIPAASTYLALTDRLCAAVGLTLAPGDVARWDLEHRTLDQTGEDVCSWGLTTAGGRWGIDLIGQPDWQAALEAAIAEVTRA